MDYVTLLEKQAQDRGGHPYLILGEKICTYQEAYAEACAFLRAEWENVFPQNYKTTVLIVTSDLYHQLLAFIAVMAHGQIPVIGHFDLPEEAERQLTEKNRIGLVLKEGPSGWILFSADGKRIKSNARAFVSRRQELPRAPYQRACMGVLSSGSTDVPKVMYRTYESWADFFPEQNKRFGIDKDSVVLVEGSFGFTGNLSIWASVLYAGCTLVVSNVLSARQWIRLTEERQVTVLYLVPAKLKLLARHVQKTCGSVRTILAGSQLLGGASAKKLKKAFPNSEIILYYGASELDYITWLDYEELLRYPESVGKAVPGVRVWSENGLIYVDTPYHVEGLSQPCTLGDAGYFNEEGYLIFAGRRGDVINKGGFKINCAKVENALAQLHGVVQAAVLPYADAGRGQEAAAFAVCEPGVTVQELRRGLKRDLMQIELPKKIILLAEMPLNSCGKPDKNALRKIAAL